jgi:hypothetical protein
VRLRNITPHKKASVGRPAGIAQSVCLRLCLNLCVAGWNGLLVYLFLAATTNSIAFADTATDRMPLPIEVLAANDAPVSRTVALQAGQADSVRSLWLQIHGLRYA